MTSLVASDLAIDRELSSISESFRFLVDVTPVNVEAARKQFLASPDTFVPNNVMASPGIKNPGDLKDLVAFLKLHR